MRLLQQLIGGNVKPVTMFQTFDGNMFATKTQAERYLENLYAKTVNKMAYDLDSLRYKHFQIQEYLNEHIDTLKLIIKIKEDLLLLDD
jgi:hypothetical protein